MFSSTNTLAEDLQYSLTAVMNQTQLRYILGFTPNKLRYKILFISLERIKFIFIATTVYVTVNTTKLVRTPSSSCIMTRYCTYHFHLGRCSSPNSVKYSYRATDVYFNVRRTNLI